MSKIDYYLQTKKDRAELIEALKKGLKVKRVHVVATPGENEIHTSIIFENEKTKGVANYSKRVLLANCMGEVMQEKEKYFIGKIKAKAEEMLEKIKKEAREEVKSLMDE